MANTTPVYARIDTDLKNKAETIMAKLGVTPSSLISMVYSQIVLNGALPFDIRLPREPIAGGALSEEELEKEIEKGIYSAEHERTYTAEEVEEMLKGKYGF